MLLRRTTTTSRSSFQTAAACTCRFAHHSTTTPIASEAPTPSYPTSPAEMSLDPSYVARYRDPSKHSKPSPTTGSSSSSHSGSFSSSATSSLSNSYASTSRAHNRRPLPSTSANIGTATREDFRKNQRDQEITKDGTPRSRRLEMERLWSGGEASPPIPLSHYLTSSQSKSQAHALLFPGSGSQYVGMGHFLKDYPAATKVWDEAEEALEGFEKWIDGLELEGRGGDLGEIGRIVRERKDFRLRSSGLKSVVFDGPQDELTRSSNAQPAILITSMAFLRTLEDNFDTPVAKEASFFLGHSSGEFTAAVASGAISFADGVRLTRLHGLLTFDTLLLPSVALSSSLSSPPASLAQMSALVINPGHSHSEVLEVINSIKPLPHQTKQEGTVEVASYNSSAQVVLAGTRDGILRACEELSRRGIASRAADLPVSAPFHCSYMKPAGEGMKVALDRTVMKVPRAPIVSGLSGDRLTTPESIAQNLIDQVSQPIRWAHCLSSLRTSTTSSTSDTSEGEVPITRLIFLGPGKALANLARRDANSPRNQPKVEQEKVEVVSVATDEDLGMLRDLWDKEN